MSVRRTYRGGRVGARSTAVSRARPRQVGRRAGSAPGTAGGRAALTISRPRGGRLRNIAAAAWVPASDGGSRILRARAVPRGHGLGRRVVPGARRGHTGAGTGAAGGRPPAGRTGSRHRVARGARRCGCHIRRRQRPCGKRHRSAARERGGIRAPGDHVADRAAASAWSRIPRERSRGPHLGAARDRGRREPDQRVGRASCRHVAEANPGCFAAGHATAALTFRRPAAALASAPPHLGRGTTSMDEMGCTSQAVARQFRARPGAVFSAALACSASNSSHPVIRTQRPR